MNKWEAITTIAIIAGVFGSISINSYVEENSAIEKAKAGLEECPRPGTYATIWVKDCVAYTESLVKDGN